MNTILAIETSCDETAASVYRGKILSSTLFSQISLHQEFGGVVPEIASRSHLEKINPIISSALKEADVNLDNIDVIGVVNRPGLPGSLLVGVCFAKALAACKNKKIIGINHLEAHIFSPFLEFDIPFPHICLTASGGHTSLYLVKGFGDFHLIGSTLDDAAGEAFDKVAKLIELPYPGGPIIEEMAAQVNFQDFFNYPRSKQKTLDFSFSGLKTAVLYDLAKRGAYNLKERKFTPPSSFDTTASQSLPPSPSSYGGQSRISGPKTLSTQIEDKSDSSSKHDNQTAPKKLYSQEKKSTARPECFQNQNSGFENVSKDEATQFLKAQVASSLLNAIADIFREKLKLAYKEYPEIKAVTFVGGVACNQFIRTKIQTLCKKFHLPLFIPSPKYCTDNAAMVAFVANYKAQQDLFDNLFLDINP